MIVLTQSLANTGSTRILFDALLDVLVLMWPVLVIVGILASSPLIVRLYRYRRLAQSGINDIDRFGGKTFEQYLEVLFKRLGYKVERTKFAGDYGGDLLLRKSGVRTVVQAKRYTKSVGVRAVQEVVAARGYYDCDESLVVSNSRYTKQARELASKNDVQLWDRDMLIHQLTATGAKQAVRRSGSRVA
jgi:restriction system protein